MEFEGWNAGGGSPRLPGRVHRDALDVGLLVPDVRRPPRGHLPLPIRPLSPHYTSRLVRQAGTGLAHHKAVRVDEFVAVLTPDHTATEPVPSVAPGWDWAAANQWKKDAVRQLAPLADALGDIETRVDVLSPERRSSSSADLSTPPWGQARRPKYRAMLDVHEVASAKLYR